MPPLRHASSEPKPRFARLEGQHDIHEYLAETLAVEKRPAMPHLRERQKDGRLYDAKYHPMDAVTRPNAASTLKHVHRDRQSVESDLSREVIKEESSLPPSDAGPRRSKRTLDGHYKIFDETYHLMDPIIEIPSSPPQEAHESVEQEQKQHSQQPKLSTATQPAPLNAHDTVSDASSPDDGKKHNVIILDPHAGDRSRTYRASISPKGKKAKKPYKVFRKSKEKSEEHDTPISTNRNIEFVSREWVDITPFEQRLYISARHIPEDVVARTHPWLELITELRSEGWFDMDGLVIIGGLPALKYRYELLKKLLNTANGDPQNGIALDKDLRHWGQTSNPRCLHMLAISSPLLRLNNEEPVMNKQHLTSLKDADLRNGTNPRPTSGFADSEEVPRASTNPNPIQYFPQDVDFHSSDDAGSVGNEDDFDNEEVLEKRAIVQQVVLEPVGLVGGGGQGQAMALENAPSSAGFKGGAVSVAEGILSVSKKKSDEHGQEGAGHGCVKSAGVRKKKVSFATIPDSEDDEDDKEEPPCFHTPRSSMPDRETMLISQFYKMVDDESSEVYTHEAKKNNDIGEKGKETVAVSIKTSPASSKSIAPPETLQSNIVSDHHYIHHHHPPASTSSPADEPFEDAFEQAGRFLAENSLTAYPSPPKPLSKRADSKLFEIYNDSDPVSGGGDGVEGAAGVAAGVGDGYVASHPHPHPLPLPRPRPFFPPAFFPDDVKENLSLEEQQAFAVNADADADADRDRDEEGIRGVGADGGGFTAFDHRRAGEGGYEVGGGGGGGGGGGRGRGLRGLGELGGLGGFEGGRGDRSGFFPFQCL